MILNFPYNDHMNNDPNDWTGFDDFDTQVQCDESIPAWEDTDEPDGDPEYVNWEENYYGADDDGYYDDDLPY